MKSRYERSVLLLTSRDLGVDDEDAEATAEAAAKAEDPLAAFDSRCRRVSSLRSGTGSETYT